MPKIKFFHLIFFLLIFIFFRVYSEGQENNSKPSDTNKKTQQKFKVFASSPIIAEWAKNIYGDIGEVVCTYREEQNSKQNKPDNIIKNIKDGDIFFSLGLKFELYAADYATTSSGKNIVLCDLLSLFDHDENTSITALRPQGKSGNVSRPKMIQPAIAHAPTVFDPLTMTETKIPKESFEQNPFNSMRNSIEDSKYFYSPKFAAAIMDEMANNFSAQLPDKGELFKINADRLKSELAPIVVKSQKDFLMFRRKTVPLCGNDLSIFISETGLKPIIISDEIYAKQDIKTAMELIRNADIKDVFYTDKSMKSFADKLAKEKGGTGILLDAKTIFPPTSEKYYLTTLKNNLEFLRSSAVNTIKR